MVMLTTIISIDLSLLVKQKLRLQVYVPHLEVGHFFGNEYTNFSHLLVG